jgi:hypothetical protein
MCRQETTTEEERLRNGTDRETAQLLCGSKSYQDSNCMNIFTAPGNFFTTYGNESNF